MSKNKLGFLVKEYVDVVFYDDDLNRIFGLPAKAVITDVVIEKRSNLSVFKAVFKVQVRSRWREVRA